MSSFLPQRRWGRGAEVCAWGRGVGSLTPGCLLLAACWLLFLQARENPDVDGTAGLGGSLQVPSQCVANLSLPLSYPEIWKFQKIANRKNKQGQHTIPPAATDRWGRGEDRWPPEMGASLPGRRRIHILAPPVPPVPRSAPAPGGPAPPSPPPRLPPQRLPPPPRSGLLGTLLVRSPRMAAPAPIPPAPPS